MTAKIKPAYDENRTILANVLPLSTPFSILIEASSACNFKCNYCVHALPNHKLKEMNFIQKNMDMETFCKIVDQICEFQEKIKIIYLYRLGESLLNKNLPYMVSLLKEKNIAEKIGLITNGSLLTNEKSINLINAGIDVIKISLQGLNSQKYLEICGVNIDFQEFVNNIAYLYKNKKNCEIYVKIADIAIDKGEEQVFYNKFGEISDRMFIENIRPWVNEINYNEIGIKDEKISMYGTKCKPQLVCSVPFYQVHIDSSGNILPCCYHIDPTHFGNVHFTSLKKVWESNEREKFLKMMLRKERNRQNDYPVCNGCVLLNSCVREEDILDNDSEKILKCF
jgi:radical SAM protein with 4Fe4S-binding SPASM domain